MEHNMDSNNNIMEGINRGALGFGLEHIDTDLAYVWINRPIAEKM